MTAQRPTKRWLLFAAIVFSGTHLAHATSNSQNASREDFNYETLVSIIHKRQIASLTELLPRLLTVFRSNYTLMYQSRSLQVASPRLPRAILFGKNGNLTCAFNGAPGEADNLECFQFRKNESAFDFRQIVFPSQRNNLSEVAFSKRNESADGGPACTKCHGEDPRPNWNGWSNWPGAYGSHNGLSLDEQRMYFDFVAHRDQHPLYRWLIQSEGPYAPYGDRLGGIPDVRFRPNLRFSDFVGRMNAYRAARLLESRVPRWQSLLFALDSFPCSLPPEQIEKLKQANLKIPQDAKLDKYKSNMDMDEIFSQLKLSSNAWSTQIFDDPSEFPYPEYEHQSGQGFLTLDVAMVMVSEMAQRGDSAFAEGLKFLATYPETSKTYQGDPAAIENLQGLYEILPDTDYQSYYHGGDTHGLDYFCPRLSQLFTDEYIRQHTKAQETEPSVACKAPEIAQSSPGPNRAHYR